MKLTSPPPPPPTPRGHRWPWIWTSWVVKSDRNKRVKNVFTTCHVTWKHTEHMRSTHLISILALVWIIIHVSSTACPPSSCKQTKTLKRFWKWTLQYIQKRMNFFTRSINSWLCTTHRSLQFLSDMLASIKQLILLPLKGQCHEIFCFWFFS